MISTLPAAGTLTDNGAPVAVGSVVPASDIAAGRLVFAAASPGSEVPQASFAFQVQDDGGTANGGVDLDPTPNTITFNLVNPHPWHNALSPLDVNADGHVNGDDARLIKSFLDTTGPGPVRPIRTAARRTTM